MNESVANSRAGEEQPGAGGGLFSRLRRGLGKTGSRLREGLAALVAGRASVDAGLLDDIETRLLSADVGLEATDAVIESLRRRLDRRQLEDADAFVAALKDELTNILLPCESALTAAAEGRPFVILMVGVNGAGKTTTIGKLARRLQDEGRSVMLAAGDTFRAAAVEQLQAWGERKPGSRRRPGHRGRQRGGHFRCLAIGPVQRRRRAHRRHRGPPPHPR